MYLQLTAPSRTQLSSVDEMLLRVYFWYEKSPKKCRELETIIEELQACFTPVEFPKTGGHKPLHACGTRSVAHKVAALDRLLNHFGAYLSHLTMLTEDPKTKPADRQKLKGYLLKWRDGKMILGSAYFCDLLKPSSTLCKIPQEDVCVVWATEAVIKISNSGDKLKNTSFEDLPTVKVLGRMSPSDESGSMIYQGVEIMNYDRLLTFLKNKHQESEYINIAYVNV